MILGIGNDIIEVKRIAANITKHGNRFLDKIFTGAEQNYCLSHKESARHFAGRFAAKEAIVKALGTGFKAGVGWLDIEILNDQQGKPYASFSTRLQAAFDDPRILISISHCHEYATGFAVWMTGFSTDKDPIV